MQQALQCTGSNLYNHYMDEIMHGNQTSSRFAPPTTNFKDADYNIALAA